MCLTRVTVPPPLAHALSAQKHPLDAGAGSEEEQGVPADVPQHEVLNQQVERFPTGGPHGLLLVRLQRSLDQHQVAHLRGDGEDQEGVEDHGEGSTKLVDPEKDLTDKTRHVSTVRWELSGRTDLTDAPSSPLVSFVSPEQ